LSGQNIEMVTSISHRIFQNTGVAVGSVKVPTIINSTILLDVNNIKQYVGWMNFNGNFTCTGEGYLYNLLFPAPLVETVVLAGKFNELDDYDPHKITIKNVIAISKFVKKHGFVPMYSQTRVENQEHKISAWITN